MLADGAGAGELHEIGPGFEEQDGEVRTAMKGQGKEGVNGDDIDIGPFAVVGLGRGRGHEGKAFRLREGKVCNGIGQQGFFGGRV